MLNFVVYVCICNPIPKSPRELKTPYNTPNMSNNSSASFFFFLEVFLLGRNGLGGLVSTSQELKKKKGDKWRSRSYQRNYGFDDLQAILLQIGLVALWTSCPAGVLGLLFTLTILSTSQVSWLQVKSQLSLINQGRSWQIIWHICCTVHVIVLLGSLRKN